MCVRGTASGLLDSRTIADGLGQFSELSLEPPAQRAEPDKRGVEPGKQLEVKVTLTNVRALVSEHNAKLLLVPGLVAGGQQDDRTDGQGRGDLSAGAQRKPWWNVR